VSAPDEIYAGMTDTTRAEARQVHTPKSDGPTPQSAMPEPQRTSLIVVCSFAAGVLAADYAIEWRNYQARNDPPPAAQAWEPAPALVPEPVKPQFVHDRLCGRVS
jgi:hypothetical protein